MANVADARKFIDEKDVQFRQSISEAVGSKLAGSINFINNRQSDTHSWHLNGNYSLGVGSTGSDGIISFTNDVEIVGFYAYWSGGSSLVGTTEINIFEIDPDGTNQGAIFSTTPKIATNAPYHSSNHVSIDPDTLAITDQTSTTGHTTPVFNKAKFNKYQVLRLDLISATTGANNVQFTIYFRPR